MLFEYGVGTGIHDLKKLQIPMPESVTYLDLWGTKLTSLQDALFCILYFVQKTP